MIGNLTWNKVWAECKESLAFTVEWIPLLKFELWVMKLMMLSKALAYESEKIKDTTN